VQLTQQQLESETTTTIREGRGITIHTMSRGPVPLHKKIRNPRKNRAAECAKVAIYNVEKKDKNVVIFFFWFPSVGREPEMATKNPTIFSTSLGTVTVKIHDGNGKM